MNFAKIASCVQCNGCDAMPAADCAQARYSRRGGWQCSSRHLMKILHMMKIPMLQVLKMTTSDKRKKQQSWQQPPQLQPLVRDEQQWRHQLQQYRQLQQRNRRRQKMVKQKREHRRSQRWRQQQQQQQQICWVSVKSSAVFWRQPASLRRATARSYRCCCSCCDACSCLEHRQQQQEVT